MNLEERLLKSYKDMSSAVKAGLWFTICNVLQRGIQFVVTPIYTRLLTTEQYGDYSLFMTWMNILIIFGTLNMSGGIYYNGIIKKEKDVNIYTSSLQVLSTICTLVTFIIVFLINAIFPKALGMPNIYILLMFIYVLFYPAIELWSAQNRVKYNYRPILIVTLIAAFFAPVIGIILVKYTHLAGYGVVVGFVLVNVIINGIIYAKNLLKGHAIVKTNDWKETLKFSIPLVPHYLSQVILGQFDRIMINYYCGQSKAGIYTLAYQVGLILSILTSGINSAFTPWAYQHIKSRNYGELKKITNLLLGVFLLINSIIILIAPEIIAILGTNEYQEAIWAIPPVMISSFVTFAYCAFGTVLFYFEDTKRASLATTMGAILNVILNVIFIPIKGYIAAGYTTLASYLVIFIIYYLFMRKRCVKEHIEVLFDIRISVGMTIVLMVISGLSLSLYKYPIVRFVAFFTIIFGLIAKRKQINVVFASMKGMDHV